PALGGCNRKRLVSWPPWSTARSCCAITNTPARFLVSYCVVRWPAANAHRSSLKVLWRWVPSPLVAQAAGLCAAEPAAPLERDRVGGPASTGSQPAQFLGDVRSGLEDDLLQHKIQRFVGVFELRH